MQSKSISDGYAKAKVQTEQVFFRHDGNGVLLFVVQNHHQSINRLFNGFRHPGIVQQKSCPIYSQFNKTPEFAEGYLAL
jgi:hypothetical protein